MRTRQTWTCTACWHTYSKTVKYPKYGASETPIVRLARAALCTSCGARGRCVIEEDGDRFGSAEDLQVFAARSQDSSST